MDTLDTWTHGIPEIQSLLDLAVSTQNVEVHTVLILNVPLACPRMLAITQNFEIAFTNIFYIALIKQSILSHNK